MCGIFGFYLNRPLSSTDIESGKLAISKLKHRGPDNIDYWCDKSKGVFLGHTRLSIQDVSPANHQPYLDSGFSLVFNGEIYNFLEIRKNLEKSGCNFSTRGDTEVFAKAWQKYGEKSLDIIDGMFAFCLFNNDTLTLGVDIFGEKPLYWYRSSEGFYFSSEPKPLVDMLDLKVDLNHQNINQFLMLGYIASPNTIYEGLYRCNPATIINISSNGKLSTRKFWQKPEQFIGKGKVASITESELDKIEETLSTALSRRIISDVPMGLFLSSGIDSSLIAALLRKNYKRDFLSLTVSYDRNSINEAIDAKKIADYLKLDHIIVNSSDTSSQHNLDELDTIYNEPNAGLTAFSVFQMSQLAKPHFTVALAGVGGDEVFYGYGKHNFLYKNRNIITNQKIMKLLRMVSSLPSRYIRKMKTLNYLTSINSNEILFALKNSPYFNHPYWYQDFSQLTKKYFNDLNSENIVTQVRDFDLDVNLPNMIIPSIERASMRHAIEVRTPYLNKDVFDVVSSIDYRKFVKFGQKNVLRKLLSRYLPKELFDHPKKGFIFPNSELLYNSKQVSKHLNESNEVFRFMMKESKSDERWNQLLLRYLMVDFYRNKS